MNKIEFKKYPKVYALGKEENDGILDGRITVQEKIDGANTSIWRDESGFLRCASRSRELKDDGFNGFVGYVQQHEGIRKILEDNPTFTLYGEWLVRHTISYNEMAYKKFYLFDIFDNEDNLWLAVDEVEHLACGYMIDRPQIFYQGEGKDITIDQLKEFVGKTELGEMGEGIAIKRHGFVNQFGDHSYAKIVTQKFHEDNGLVFGGNNKHSETYWEMYIVNKYCTKARVDKIMNKLQPEIDKRLHKEHTPRIANSCYHDMLTEDIWDISKKCQKIDFNQLKRLSMRKFIQIYHDILDDNLSIADQ